MHLHSPIKLLFASIGHLVNIQAAFLITALTSVPSSFALVMIEKRLVGQDQLFILCHHHIHFECRHAYTQRVEHGRGLYFRASILGFCDGLVYQLSCTICRGFVPDAGAAVFFTARTGHQ